MSPQGIGITTTYKTRVALEKPCKERQGIVIGQLKDSHELKRKVCNFEDVGCAQINENSRNEFSRSGGFVRNRRKRGLCRVKAECNCGAVVLSLEQASTDQ